MFFCATEHTVYDEQRMLFGGSFHLKCPMRPWGTYIFAWLTTVRQKAAKSGSISVTTLKMKLHIFVVCVSLISLCLK